ncbi:DUF6230 family protein [Streptomyces sp. SID11385]|uniref:DUF6230 family protein n=1 Tax=Streptomyces sp. SID11385 TaxID=2706031 RepID=UPI0013CB802B|nr:DUF6230 family protein [Streptomyces sp. SID11385]NEA39330.1 cholesterol esterase [Streptomyces sp. SID11385]
MESVARGGTRWRRFAVVMVPGVAATAAIGVAVAQGALAASFSVSGQQFKVSADRLEGTGFAQYGGLDVGPNKETGHAVAISSFKSADLTNMCQSVVTPNVPLVGTVTLRLTAGGKGTPAHADNLYVDLDDLSGDATFGDIDIGVAAGAKTRGPKLAPNTNPGAFAQQAKTATIENVRQTAWATTAGTFKLSGLHMAISKGVKECY